MENAIALTLVVAKVLGRAAKTILAAASIQRALLSWLGRVLATLGSRIAIRRAASPAICWACNISQFSNSRKGCSGLP